MFKTAKRRRIDFDFQSVFLFIRNTIVILCRLPSKAQNLSKSHKISNNCNNAKLSPHLKANNIIRNLDILFCSLYIFSLKPFLTRSNGRGTSGQPCSAPRGSRGQTMTTGSEAPPKYTGRPWPEKNPDEVHKICPQSKIRRLR